MVLFASVSGFAAAILLLPGVLGQTSSDCTCPSAGALFTTTIFYDPNTMMMMTGGSATTNAGATGVNSGATGSAVATGVRARAVVGDVNSVTSKSQALQAPASSLTAVNGPLIAIGQGPLPSIIAGFADIVSTATAAVGDFNNLGSVPAGSESDAIFNALRDFVTVHQQLLSILIGKSGLFQNVPIVGQPVAQALRGIESVVDTIANSLIDSVQSRAADIQAQAGILSNTLTLAINSYSGAQTSNVASV